VLFVMSPHPLPLVCLQNIDVEDLEQYVGYELPAKFIEVDEVRHDTHTAASSTASSTGQDSTAQDNTMCTPHATACSMPQQRALGPRTCLHLSCGISNANWVVTVLCPTGQRHMSWG
jgi:hypothetical protein